MSETGKITASTLGAIISTILLTAMVYGVDIPIPSAEQLGQWPAATLLGAVAMVSSYCSYITWKKLLEHNDKYHIAMNKLTMLLAERPCVLKKNGTELNKIHTNQDIE